VHVTVDTGLGREGCLPADAGALAAAAEALARRGVPLRVKARPALLRALDI
jgi:hypothetical protein